MKFNLNADDIVIVGAKRTPFGSFGGSFKDLTATDLAVEAAKGALAQSALSAQDISTSIWGNVVQSSSDAIYLARHVLLRLGGPIQSDAITINRLCGSGFEAIAQGAYQIMVEGADFALVGGSENMSQIPYVSRNARFGFRMGPSPFEDYLTAALTDSFTGSPMAITAELLGELKGIGRKECDELALSSQIRAAKAWSEGLMQDEITSVSLVHKKASSKVVEKDEHMRADSTLESLQKLPSLFKKDGLVSAGNASGITDGACALILCTRKVAQQRKIPILATIRGWASAGCDPKIMGIGPVPATHKLLVKMKKNGMNVVVGDFQRVEINEAFAAQYLAVEKDLGLSREKTNVEGGAIAIGHPLAASGARLVTHLIYSLRKNSGGLGLASACIGGGQGMSVAIEV